MRRSLVKGKGTGGRAEARRRGGEGARNRDRREVLIRLPPSPSLARWKIGRLA